MDLQRLLLGSYSHMGVLPVPLRHRAVRGHRARIVGVGRPRRRGAVVLLRGLLGFLASAAERLSKKALHTAFLQYNDGVYYGRVQ